MLDVLQIGITGQTAWIAALIVIVIIFVMIAARTAFWIVQPYEQGIWIVLGNYRGTLDPGVSIVYPFISTVIKLDLRTQVLDVPRQEVITKDNSPTNVDAIIYIKVVDVEKAYFEVTNYKAATINLAQTTLRSVIGDMELDEILYNRERINAHLREVLDEATDAWGVRVESVEIREVDPVGTVKQAMEEQTAAERERRAAILRADGKKRSAILEAEGNRQARILNAEGNRQSKILNAEGERMAEILTAQGEAQRLRILSLGAGTLDEKSLTFLSLNTLQEMAKGEATKILFPFEVTRLMEGASEYLGAGRKVPSRKPSEVKDLEDIVGKAEEILGEIPGRSEIRKQLSEIEKEVGKEKDMDRKEIREEAEKDAREVLEEVKEEVGELKLDEEEE
ncbi:MAG: SPFH domain-containing protein [Thermoplasmatota archaeon]